MTSLKSRVKAGLEAAINYEEKPLIVTDITSDVIAKMEEVGNQSLAIQMKGFQQSVYLLCSRFKDQAEQLNALTTSIQELQHEQEQVKTEKPLNEFYTGIVNKLPKPEDVFVANQAWTTATNNKKSLS